MKAVEIDFGKQFKFECVLAYEIVPNGQGTYTIHVPTEKMLAPVDRVCPPHTCPIKVPVTQLRRVNTALPRNLAHMVPGLFERNSAQLQR